MPERRAGDDLAAVSTEVGGAIRAVPDFPSPGIVFRDITPLLSDGPLLRTLVDALAATYSGTVDVVAGIESRGFLLAAPLATALGLGLVPIRKAGKLPPPVIAQPYELEYGSAVLELREGALAPGARVLLVDDVLATGGTVGAAADLVERAGGMVSAVCVLIELLDLGGRAALAGRRVDAVVAY
ncbi:adenine phosphoribosyltransferase [Beutenbergia cavernae DSM 12333]|uniref:Adenine phosphoribosyltransferase n=1 Tax=Beutenbergia cavernae (strain ATCC BAA-8 / DSM 12333 / CCUG 43141 / JCM 11478 / NBRC 16432 / NCIMB 13614 / HKI 0122) TaxID=471853 RepID=C5C5R2_BEUC1|nr:adenine phosphoribosyltransferase [Beutenbergia cavernae]ACQ80253.1 adenine phosphoribosyltransferase [Beutenbergia cavernae DSM 12333]